jgi:uncharacterized protein
MRNLTTLTALTLLSIGLVVSSGCNSALAQDSAKEDGKTRTISVSGTGSVRVKPDIATAVVGSSKVNPKLSEAKATCDQVIAQIKAALKKQNVDDDDIQTVQYQIYRVVPNPNFPNQQTGWKVVHMLQVRTKQPDKIATIVDAAVNAGATDVSSIGFSVDSLAKHRTKSRELAIEAAKDKALQLAALMKVNLAEVISVTEGGGDYYPQAQSYANMAMDGGGAFGGAGSGISGGQIEVPTSVQVVFGIR